MAPGRTETSVALGGKGCVFDGAVASTISESLAGAGMMSGGKRLANRPLFLPQGLNVGDSGTAQTL
jgi:hypothetical protein